MSRFPETLRAFTLAEVALVVTILAILSTIGFIGYEKYAVFSRDSVRLNDLSLLHASLSEFKKSRWAYPFPEDFITVNGTGGTSLAYQGYVGARLLQSLGILRGKDPKNGAYYTYVRDRRGGGAEIMGFFEESGYQPRFAKIILPETAFATSDYSELVPVVAGKRMGVFLQSGTLAPIQEILTGSISLADLAASGTVVAFSCTDTSETPLPLTGGLVTGIEPCFDE